MVECQLPKLDVAGSIPVSRSNSLPDKDSAYSHLLRRCLFAFHLCVEHCRNQFGCRPKLDFIEVPGIGRFRQP